MKTIHIHQTHLQESGLPLIEYIFCILHEYRCDYTAQELSEYFGVTDRTIRHLRSDLTDRGYLNKTGPHYFELTDKLYPKKQVVK